MASNWQNRKDRIAQINYLLEVMTEPVLAPEEHSFSSLNEAFATDDKDNYGLDRCSITMAVLNFKGRSDTDSSYAIHTFMIQIQDYLPIRLRSKCWGRTGWALNKTGEKAHGASKEMIEKFNELREWLFTFRSKIENELSTKFIMGNKPQYLETLKRRFKENWSEKFETQNETHNTVEGGLSVQISFEDA